ncbi:hypothetical protein HPB50_014226 [Hyalomma asiaticum]|uniref:Uncharacterized protein n=1 Tax=Hyalomma asiaticum TaxID=266040 RepID=A0ACB7RV75_HYAAI|nr:hypothetical protein HPB50_014226 [Hyalomma asiaticum]
MTEQGQQQQTSGSEASLPPPEEWEVHGESRNTSEPLQLRYGGGTARTVRYTRRVSGTREYVALCAFTYCLPVGAFGIAVLIIYVFIVSPCLEQPLWAPCLPPAAQSGNASLFYFDHYIQECSVKGQLPIPCLHQTPIMFGTERECMMTCGGRPAGVLAPRECRRLRLAPCTANDLLVTYIPAGASGCQPTNQCHGFNFVFPQLADCQSACFGNIPNRCVFPSPSRHCSNWSRAVRWFYNAYTRTCQEFRELCLSGRNRFASYDQCLRACVTT